mgnify:CR=1 FL=1
MRSGMGRNNAPDPELEPEEPRIKEWSELTLDEKIRWLPERHSYPVKCMLYLVFNSFPVMEWRHVYAVLERMGYVPVREEEDIGGGMTRLSIGWTKP